MRSIDHAAIAIVGAVLLGLFVAFERWAAGSWREFGALLLAMVVWFGGGFALDAGLHRAGRSAPGEPTAALLLLVLPAIGAAAGASYAVAAGAPFGGPVLKGAAAAGVLAVLHFRQVRRKSAVGSSPPGA